MERIRKFWISCTSSEYGASLVEYALLLALIALVCIAAMGLFGGGVGTSISRSANSIVGG
jgi:Flp pilus assembly pilin Flp